MIRTVTRLAFLCLIVVIILVALKVI